MPRKLLILITMLCCGALPATVQAQSTADDSAPHCKYVKLSTLPLSFAAGTSSPEIDGSINSTPVRLLVDTGAYQTSLYRSRIEALDLPLRHLNAYAAGVGGEAAQYGVLLQELSIGAIHGGRRMFKVLDDGERKSRVSGLAGADFLFQQDLEISYASRHISFFHPLNCDDAFLAYWNPDASVVPFGPMATTESRPWFFVEVNGQKLRAMIDTGAWRTVIDQAAAARVGVTESSPGVIKVPGKVTGVGKHELDSWSASFDSVIIGAETIRHSRIIVADLYASIMQDSPSARQVAAIDRQPEIVLGADFLKSHRVLFAMAQRRIYLSYEGGPVFCSDCTDMGTKH